MKFIFTLLFLSVINCFGQSIPQDKQRHFAVGVAVAGMVYITAWDYYHEQNPLTAHVKATKVTLITNITMSVLKELYDYQNAKRLNTWNDAMRVDSYGDMLATFLGGATVTLVISIGTGK
jgi:hypothetical protein